MVKLLAFDLDGTLLNSSKTISPRTLKALSACRERGILLAFATARSRSASSRVAGLFMPDFFIENNGALVRDGDTIIHRASLPAEQTDALLRDLCEIDGHIALVTVDGQFLSNRPILLKDFAHYTVRDLSQGAGLEAMKLTVDIADERDALKVAARHPHVQYFSYTGETWRCYMPPRATKQHALAALLTYLGLTTDEAAAFGDDVNDAGMLALCRYGVAMGNAAPVTQHAAAFVTDTNDNDGIAKWIEQHILSEEA